MVAQALEMLVEVQDVDACVLSGSGYCQVGEGEAMGAVGAGDCQFAHRRQDRALHAAIHRNLAQALQGLLGRTDIRPRAAR